jgi:RNA polymerase sigma factor (sigma-70 family)
MPNKKDVELMQKAAEGDLEALVSLYIRFVPALRHFFTKHGSDQELCNELVQRVLVYLLTNRVDFRTDYSFEKYLFHIARNTLNKELRRSRRSTELDLEKLPHKNDDSNQALSEPETILYAKEVADAVEHEKAKLTDKQRQAVEDFLAGEPCSREPRKSRLKRALRRLRRELRNFGDE